MKNRLGLGRIPDIRLIFNAGYPVGYLANIRYPANYRISSIGNQLDIRNPDSFNIREDIENGRISGLTQE